MSQARLRLVLVALALVATACGTGEAATTQDLPPAPAVVDVVVAVPEFPNDGRHRVVLTPEPVTPVAPTGLPWIRDLSEVGPAIIGQLPDGAVLMERDGLLGYTSDTEFVPVAAIEGAVATASGATTEPAQSELGHPVIDELAALPEVERIASIGDGTYAAVVTDLDVLDRAGVPYQPDAPLALTTEPLEPYQWAHSNDGTNLNNVGISPLPLQVTDSDADVVEVDRAASGAGVVVAVVDSGIDFSHPDLTHAQWRNAAETCGNGLDDDLNGYVDDCAGWDFANDDNEPWAPTHNPHGTHVAGIVAASADNGIGVAGVAPDAQIMDLSVSSDPSGGSITASSIAMAIRYATDNGADIVNLSLGTSPGTPVEAVTPIIAAAEYAEANGVLLVAAAGNNGVNIDSAAVYPASVPTSNMMVAGASTPGEVRAFFSNYGTTVDVFAPGHYILSTTPGSDYQFMSGTSQAAPLVAAVAALYLETAPGAVPDAVNAQLVGTGDEVDAYAEFSVSGVRVNAARAVGEMPDFGNDMSNAHVVIRGLADADESGVDADISMYLPGGQFNEPFHWEAGFVALMPNGVFGIIDHTVEVDGRASTTDRRGSVELGDESATQVSISTVLPVGTYGLVIEAIPNTDPTARLGQAFIATFTVGDPTPLSPDPADPDSSGPGDGGSVEDPSGVSPNGASGESPDDRPDETMGDGGGVTTPPVEPVDGGEGTAVDEPLTGEQDGGDEPSDEIAPVTDPLDPDDPAPVALEPAPTSPDAHTPATPDGAAPVPVPGTEPGGSVAWAITDISPRVGPVMAEIPVTIVGVFPEPVSVWFGDQPGTAYFQSDTLILVSTPLRSEPGQVDVSLRSMADEVVIAVPDGFTFVDDQAPPVEVVGPIDPVVVVVSGPTEESTGGSNDGFTGTGESDPATDDPAGNEPVFEPTPTPEPIDPGGITVPVDSGADGGVGTEEPDFGVPDPGLPGPDVDPEAGIDDGPAPQRQSRAAVLGEPVDLDNGLTGTPLDGLSAVGGVPACASDPCRTRRVGV